MFDLQLTDHANRLHLQVTDELSVGPPGNVFLFGGVGHAAAIKALKQVTGREIIWSTAKFSSFARRGACLDLEVEVKTAGYNTTQAQVVATCEGAVVFTVLAALGERPGQPIHQWPELPRAPQPDACAAAPIWPRQDGAFHKRLDLRLIGGAGPVDLGDGPDPTGKMLLWARALEDLPVDASQLAIFADLVPAGVASAFGRKAGGNSLDNTLRIAELVPTRWVLCEVSVLAVRRGFAHGEIRMFAEDGTLMGVGSQSLVMRLLDE